MEQAARSGKQNIPEGYLQKSLEGRIKLVGVARGSLEELLNDYLDFLRQRNLELWDMNSSEAQAVRRLVSNKDRRPQLMRLSVLLTRPTAYLTKNFAGWRKSLLMKVGLGKIFSKRG